MLQVEEICRFLVVLVRILQQERKHVTVQKRVSEICPLVADCNEVFDSGFHAKGKCLPDSPEPAQIFSSADQ